MSVCSLEERVANLEAQMAALLKPMSARQPSKDAWRSTLGMFDGDEIMASICEEALRYRAEDRRQYFEQFSSSDAEASADSQRGAP